MKEMGSSFWIFLTGIFGVLGVSLGAFGAHALKSALPLQVMTIFETAVRYHLFHTLALFGCAILMQVHPQRAPLLGKVAALFAGGIILFSGSLYGLALSDIRILGIITPVGGAAWIIAWGLLAWAYRRKYPAQ